MKLKRNIKILSLIMLLVISIVSIAFVGVKNVGIAEGAVTADASRYFDGAKSVQFNDKGLEVVLENEKEATFKREMVIDDFEIVFDIEVEEGVSFTKLEISFESDLNKANAEKGTITYTQIGIGSDITLKQGDFTGLNGYEKIKKADKTAGTMSLKAYATGDVKVTIQSIDQQAGVQEESFKQSFVTTNGKFSSIAYPVVSLNEGFFAGDGNKKILGQEYTVSYTLYSITGLSSEADGATASTSKLIMEPLDCNVGEIIVQGTKISFRKLGSMTFEVGFQDGEDLYIYETYYVNVIEEGDANAPVYVTANDEDIQNFKDALEEKLYSDEEKTTYVALGSSEKITLPSMKDFVTDETYSYADLTKTVYYMTPDNTWTTSSGSMTITLSEAGLYKFFVIFKDNNEVGDTAEIFKALGEGKTNAEIQEDYTIDDATLNNYRNYIFTFEIYDNAPISVKAKEQGVAYIGVKVNAVPFELKNYNTKTVYKLEFKAEGSDTWTEIQPVSKLKKGDEGYDVAYNGSLEFVPQAKGTYKISCTITKNTNSADTHTASAEIRCIDSPSVVKSDNPFFKENVWFFVFLGTGTLSLIGIVVLIFVKPKED